MRSWESYIDTYNGYRVIYEKKTQNGSCIVSLMEGVGTPLFSLYGDVPLDRVWFFGLALLRRV